MKLYLSLLMSLFCGGLCASEINVNYSGPEKPNQATKFDDFYVPIRDAGTTTYVAVHETNLRSEPKAGAKVVAELIMGAKVRIEKRIEAKERAGFRVDYWYKVSVISKKKSKRKLSGFIFGGSLSDAVFQKDVDLDGKKETVSVAWAPNYKGRVRVLDEGKVNQLDLTPGGQAYICCGGNLEVQWVSKKKAGLPLLRILSSVEACGDYNLDFVSFNTGKPLLALSLNGLSDPPYHSDVSVIFNAKNKTAIAVHENREPDPKDEDAPDTVTTEKVKYRLEKGRYRILKRAPKPRIGGKAKLPKKKILKVINKNIGRIQYCYERGLRSDPGLQGKVILEWHIRPSGGVGGVEAVESTLHNAKAVDCMKEAVRNWRFPKPRGKGSVIVTYPFMFNTL